MLKKRGTTWKKPERPSSCSFVSISKQGDESVCNRCRVVIVHVLLNTSVCGFGFDQFDQLNLHRPLTVPKSPSVCAADNAMPRHQTHPEIEGFSDNSNWSAADTTRVLVGGELSVKRYRKPAPG